MKDPTIPTLSAQDEGSAINLTIPSTQSLVEDQGYTYNQAGFSFNQAGVMYGGVYNVDQSYIPIDLTIPATNALLYDQGYTYNQSGFSYDQLLVAYAGIYNYNEDIVPMTLSFEDLYTKFTPPPSGNNQSIGPGFFMLITH